MGVISQTKPPFNYNYVLGLANLIDYEDTPVTQTGVQVDAPLQDLFVPRIAFAQSGQKVIVGGYGVLTTPVAIGQISFAINGTRVAIANSAISATQFAWKYDIELLRQGSNLLVFASSQLGIGITTSSFTVGQPILSNTTLSAFNFTQDITLLFRYTGNDAGHTLTQSFCWASIH